MTTADSCHCTGCSKCQREDNHCRRSVVFDVDHLCEECHEQAPRVSSQGSKINMSGESDHLRS